MPSTNRNGAKALRDVQERFAAAVMTPLTPEWGMRAVAPDGRPMADFVGDFIKPNDRLTSFERIELYNKQYWYRLIDVMYEDYPGVAAVLGQKRFNKFCEAYLQKYPSRSGLLRNLGRHIVQFIDEQPPATAPYTGMARDMARYEWAQVQAFDAAAKPALTPRDLPGKNPAATHLKLQPGITLLELRHAVDRLHLAVKKESFHSEASNATDGLIQTPVRRRSARAEHVFMVVHRYDNSVFTKRIDAEAFAILHSLHEGKTIAAAIEAATPDDADETQWPARVREWFGQWMSLGWFCKS